MDIKNFLLAAIALAVIGAGGSISMHYQMLRMEHTKKRELADQYFPKELCFEHEVLFDLPYYDPEMREETIADIEKIKEKMHADGYSYAEIAEIDKVAREQAHDKFEINWKNARKEEEKKKQQGNITVN